MEKSSPKDSKPGTDKDDFRSFLKMIGIYFFACALIILAVYFCWTHYLDQEVKHQIKKGIAILSGCVLLGLFFIMMSGGPSTGSD